MNIKAQSVLFFLSLGMLVLWPIQSYGTHEFEDVITCRTAANRMAGDAVVSLDAQENDFPLFEGEQGMPIFVSAGEFAGVLRVAQHLSDDLNHVTGEAYPVQSGIIPSSGYAIVAGTLGNNDWIQRWVEAGKIDVEPIRGKWESSITQVVEQPFPGVDRALVIVGSDKRGTIFGMFELSRQIGVSPWYWWADVPIEQRKALYITPEARMLGEPKVKYRGIFINDEEPALGGWVREKFGDFNHEFYTKVFELVLRLKGNYLWPAMWGRSLFDDDPLSDDIANEYGVVLGTSHHEPLMRSHVEWARYGSGPWDYDQNEDVLKQFWREGIERMGENESIVNVGMRGDGDTAMSEESNIALLERIVGDQREIIEEVTGRPASETPQMWALYKEVQEYYDRGMRVPDDITLLLCDDNWGNIRKLPRLDEAPRTGGYGIYYHFDYVGGPRNYKWINTVQISRTWEQMRLAYQYGATQVWIVNVGDIKPVEFPTTFFLDYAWDPSQWTVESVVRYTQKWAAEQFGQEHARAIADVLGRYTQYVSRRTPEMLDQTTYSLIEDNEFERVTDDFIRLQMDAEAIAQQLPEAYRPAYFQLVEHPVTALATLYRMYLATARNHLYSDQARSATQTEADLVQQWYDQDAVITQRYHELLDGKWNHMMDQIHIGYTYWQQPDVPSMPEVRTLSVMPGADMGVAVEGSSAAWPTSDALAVPTIDNLGKQSRFIEVFNRGADSFGYTVNTNAAWLVASAEEGEVDEQVRFQVSVDWDMVPADSTEGIVTVNGPGGSAEVRVPIRSFTNIPEGFVEREGHIAMEAAHFSAKRDGEAVAWMEIPRLGRTLSAMTTEPGTIGFETLDVEANPYLEYSVNLDQGGPVTLNGYFSPVLNFGDTKPLRVAFSVDEQAPQVIDLHLENTRDYWYQMAGENICKAQIALNIADGGHHALRYWMIDPGVVLQRIVLSTGEESETYLGPEENSYYTPKQPE